MSGKSWGNGPQKLKVSKPVVQHDLKTHKQTTAKAEELLNVIQNKKIMFQFNWTFDELNENGL